jgi:hypothetical protein
MTTIPAEDCKRLMETVGVFRSTPRARRRLMESILRNVCGTLRVAAILAMGKSRHVLTDDMASLAWGYFRAVPPQRLYGDGADTSRRQKN